MSAEPAPEMPLNLSARVNPRFSFALHQNAVALLLELTLTNLSERPCEDVLVVLATTPAFIKRRVWRVSRLEPGEVLRVPTEDLGTEVEAGLLGGLTESEAGSVTLTATSGEAVVGRWTGEVQVLARNEWGGLHPLPELVAAFVQPNDAAVDRVLRQAAAILAEHDLPDRLDGYLSGGRQRAWDLVQAIWGAVCALGIAYALPPASFEVDGQKVRAPSQIWDGRVATCLDSTLLFAACLEQCHLHPLVVVLSGHAFAGCWLVDESLPVVALDDPAALRNRIQLGELIVFETTLATQRPVTTLRTAMNVAEQELAEDGSRPLLAAVDIHRARMQRILPLASTAEVAAPLHEPSVEAVQPAFEQAPEWGDGSAPAEASPAPQRLSGRLLQWQGRLLDLTLRNRLLNFRLTSGALPLDAPDPAGIEDRLADGRALRLVPRPPLGGGAAPVGPRLQEQRGQEGIVTAYARAALERNELTVGLPPEELTARLLALFRAARTSLQENGANTLHLAAGFLVWRREDHRGQVYRAPLVLIPVNLTRTSVRSGFRLVQGEEEPKFNQTLLQMLEQEYHLSIPELRGDLPRDERGVDLPAVWRLVAERVKDIRGWEVVLDATIATFSFTKFVMWKDMVDRVEQLQRNRVVRHLVAGTREPYPHVRPFPQRSALDASCAPATTYCPLPADASQLAAVMAAAGGQDFVLIGPPGTGKSQTITNLICHCLATGKTVLFIAEKTAALEVVQRRLEAVGVGPFCLELHSNKVNKAAVLAQLVRAREAVAEPAPEPFAAPGRLPGPQLQQADGWEQAATRVQSLRRELNDVVEHLHTPHRNGLTVFAAVGRVLGGRDAPELPLSWPSVEAHDGSEVAGLAERAARLDTLAAAAGLHPGDPLTPLRQQAWSPHWQAELLEAARGTATLGRKLLDAADGLCAAVDLPPSGLEPRSRQRLAHLAQSLLELAGCGWTFVLRADAGEICAALQSAAELVQRRRAVIPTLSRPYDLAAAAQLDLTSLGATLAEAGRAWWLRRWLLERGVGRALAACARPSSVPAAAALAPDVEGLSAVRALDGQIAAVEALQAQTDGLWRGLATDLPAAQRAQELTAALRRVAGGLAGRGRQEVHRFPAHCCTPAGLADLARRAQEVLDALGPWEASAQVLLGLMATESGALAEDSPAAWNGICAAFLANGPRLQAWCAWQRERRAGVGAGLSPLVEAMEAGRLARGEAERAFAINYCRWWLPRAVDADATLCAFVPQAQEARIAEFAAADDAWMALVGGQVRTLLASALRAALGKAGRGSPESRALGVLQHEAAKKKRHLPVRQLLGQLQPILPVLAPCLLMSPLSVAQYLSPDAPPFDLVVFDEASQIPAWDAIGAIARGEQLVVVGDPRQLPPTTFFGRTDDEEGDDLDADLESILDDCLGADLPRLQLTWHYRSRHEGLIAFSNERYYGNTLVTFPSPVTDDHAVRYHHVPGGVYAKGTSRTNPLEAQAVVAFVLARLRDPAFVASAQSIGVVTFNAQQQHLIEDLFEREREGDEGLERFFAEAQTEPVFVKNLESVQGDERDVMCFSVTYGPDEQGAVSMNFGPLNRQGGERRLNVAITRARRELHVFATLQPEQIDLNRTRARGVEDLRRFLQYAQGGVERGAAPGADAPAGPDGDVVGVVCRALQSRGWQVQTGVGASLLRVDIGVVDPDLPGAFLAGIICDGPAGDAAATARDRDLLRQRQLEGLGWLITRTWSLEWWLDAAGALKRLDAFLSRALATAREGRPSEVDGAASEAEAAEEVDLAAEFLSPDAFRLAPVPSAEAEAPRFFEGSYDADLLAIVRQVVDAEGPIRADVLARRVGRVHGFARTGARILERVSRLARGEFGRTREGGEEFFWPTGSRPGEWGCFRRPGTDLRPVEEISLAELRALARACRGGERGMEEGVRLMAQVAGLQRLRAASRARLERAWRAEQALPADERGDP